MPRSLEQWLLHQTQVHPHDIDLGLTRVKRVLERLDWRQPGVPVITVGGTNGKGSVTEYCRAMLAAAGCRVGTFTSPHLRDYRERIRVHDRLVSEGELVRAFERIEDARGEISLTFFEFNAMAAFLTFAAATVDAWVLEVGLGGRLDAVNVIDPTVSVVVSVGLDHQEFLGDSVDAIAREKAGIFRRGRPAVIGSRDAPGALYDAASAIGARCKRLGEDFDAVRGVSCWQYRGSRWNLPDLPAPALVGDAQYANAATAIAALEELEPRLCVSAAAIRRGLGSVHLPGRFQIIAPGLGQPTWILDVAHNPDAARVLRANLLALPAAGRTLAVCGILADKDAPAIAAELRGRVDGWWLASTDGARGTSGDMLAARIAALLDAPFTVAGDVASACRAASAAARPGDRIVVFGSFHTVGPALNWLDGRGLLPAAALPDYTHALRGQ